MARCTHDEAVAKLGVKLDGSCAEPVKGPETPWLCRGRAIVQRMKGLISSVLITSSESSIGA